MKGKHYLFDLKVWLIILLIVFKCCGQFYSKRTKCSQNKLSFDSQISLFYQNTQFSGVNYTEIIEVMGMIKKLYHYGKKVNQSLIPNHRCQKYFLDENLCCRYEDLDKFTDKMVDLYTRTYFKSKHPIINYLQKIYDQYKLLNSSCLSNFDLRIPDKGGIDFTNATVPLGDLVKNISLEMTKIKVFELDFILNSVCTLCIGLKDFKTFLHPTHTDLTKSNRLIYNQAYFTNATSFIAQRMINSKNYADKIQSFITTQLLPKLSSATQCSPLSTLIKNSAQIIKRKVCRTLDQCQKFAQKYIGGPGAPAYSKTFTSISQNKGLTKVNLKVVTSNQSGFKGNLTYSRYLGSSPPSVLIKGNQYTYA